MRRYEQQRNAETRSIQTGVQLLLIAIGVLFLVSGLVLTASGSTIGATIGSFADDSPADDSPLGDTETEGTDDDTERDDDGSDRDETGGDEDGGDDSDESDGADDGDADEGDDNGDESDDGSDADDPDGSDDDALEATHNLSVLVEDDGGGPIENATVTLEGDSDQETDVDEDGEAVFDVEEGEYTVTVEADGYDGDEADVELDGDDEEITLVLEAVSSDDDAEANDDEGERTLTVLVEDDEGDPVENTTVTLEESDSLGFFGGAEETESDEDGEATFDVQDGEYSVAADAEGYERDEVDVEIDGEDEVILLLLEHEDA